MEEEFKELQEAYNEAAKLNLQYEETIKKLQNQVDRLTKQLIQLGEPPNPVKHVIDNYGNLWETYLEVCNKFGLTVYSPGRVAKAIILHLEGNKYNKPLSTPQRFLNYLGFLNTFTKEEYASMQFVVSLKSPESVIYDHDRIILALKRQVPLRLQSYISSLKK